MRDSLSDTKACAISRCECARRRLRIHTQCLRVWSGAFFFYSPSSFIIIKPSYDSGCRIVVVRAHGVGVVWVRFPAARPKRSFGFRPKKTASNCYPQFVPKLSAALAASEILFWPKPSLKQNLRRLILLATSLKAARSPNRLRANSCPR